MSEHARVLVDQAPTRCPFCKGALDKGDELVACAACGARHHAACHREHGACATCGGHEALVSATRRARTRDVPPAGSRIVVERGEDGTRLTWPATQRQDWVFLLLLTAAVVSAPLVLWLLWQRRRYSIGTITLGEDQLVFPAQEGLRVTTRVVRREDLGAVRVDPLGGGTPNFYKLTLDVGIERLTVRNGLVLPALTGPELEWIAARIEAWRG